jgi:hypothetical protein
MFAVAIVQKRIGNAVVVESRFKVKAKGASITES